jgi:hypothetical protein
VTKPTTFTSFHQDGNGTVDSGHYCHKGYNEVILFRRLSQSQEKQMEAILFGESYDPLKPHGNGVKPDWPTKRKIEECAAKGYMVGGAMIVWSIEVRSTKHLFFFVIGCTQLS